MENNSNKILLKGIVRNTAGSICDDGEFEDALNIHYKDGSWRAVNNMDMVKGLESFTNNYSYIYIHSNGYKHAIGVKDGALYWFADWDAEKGFVPNDEVRICYADEETRLYQAGNLISVTSINRIFQYYVYEEHNNLYRIEKDYNLDFISGMLDFRLKNVEDDRKRPRYLFGYHDVASSLSKYNMSTEQIQEKKTKDELIDIYDTLKTAMVSIAKKEKMFTGSYFKLIYAIQLFDGTVDYHSAPLLLSPTFEPHIDVEQNVGKLNPSDSEKIIFNDGIVRNDLGDGSDSDISPNDEKQLTSKYTDWNIFRENKDNDKSVRYLAKRRDTEYIENGIFKTTIHRLRAHKLYSDTYDKYGVINAEQWHVWIDYYKKYPNCFGFVYRSLENSANVFQTEFNRVLFYRALQKLQYKITSTITEEQKKVIRRINVYVSKPIQIEKDKSAVDFTSLNFLPLGDFGGEFVDEEKNGDPATDEGEDGFKRKYFHYLIKNKDAKELSNELINNDEFYRIGYIDGTKLKQGDEWIDFDIKGSLEFLETNELLQMPSYSSINEIKGARCFNYNGRLHAFNLEESIYLGRSIKDFFVNNIKDEGGYDEYKYSAEKITAEKFEIYQRISLKEGNDVYSVTRYEELKAISNKLIPLLSYPNDKAYQMEMLIIRHNETGTLTYFYKKFPLEMCSLNYACYISEDLKPVEIKFTTTEFQPFKDANKEVIMNIKNKMKVSLVNNHLYFPNESTYLIGSTEIIGMATVETALSTGQAGDAPLYVFTKDGIYALFVDSSGQLVYSVSRPIARDVCNNPDSIISIDGAVLFSTDRGLMMIQGSEVTELSANIEGDIKRFLDKENYDYIKQIEQATGHIQLYACQNHMSKDEFKIYLKGAKVGYNHLEREVIVSNKDYDYSYIYKDGYWSKVSYSVEYFVNDYPHLYYAHQGDKKLFDYSREIKKGNDTLMITRPIKLGTQEFKNGFRVVARGRFETQEREPVNLDNNILTIDSYEPIVSMDKLKGIKVKFAQTKTKCHISAKLEYKIGLRVDYIKTDSLKLDLSKTEVVFPISEDVAFERKDNLYVGGLTDIVLHEDARLIQYNNAIYMRSAIEESANDFIANVENGTYKPYNYNWKQHYGLYVFGSYDCKKFSLLGMQERTGAFRDIGCNIERVDCKYFRIMLIGSLTEESSLEYIEFTAKNKILSKKIR